MSEILEKLVRTIRSRKGSDVKSSYTSFLLSEGNDYCLNKLKEEVESETIITVTNKITKQEYGSDAEADADVKDPNTATKKEDIRRDVLIDIKKMPSLLAKSDLVKA